MNSTATGAAGLAPAETVLVFDVNETLLDLKVLDPYFETAFGSASVRGQWFAQMLQLAFVGAITERYVDFTSAQRAALTMLAERQGVDLDPTLAQTIVDSMSRLPPHEEVAGALGRLAANGWRLVALTNSPKVVVTSQLENAGVQPYFEAIFSADEVRSLKPSARAYLMSAERLGLPPSRLCLVAAHAWDVSGALAAGLKAAFVARGGVVPSPLGEPPTLRVADIAELAERLTGRV